MNHRMRFVQGLLICMIAIVVPLSISAGIYFRTINYPEDDVILLVQPPPYGFVLEPRHIPLFPRLDLKANFRADTMGNLQLELSFPTELHAIKPAVFWCPETEDWRGMKEWIHLGPIIGTGIHRYELPEALRETRGIFIIASKLTSEVLDRGAMPGITLPEKLEGVSPSPLQEFYDERGL